MKRCRGDDLGEDRRGVFPYDNAQLQCGSSVDVPLIKILTRRSNGSDFVSDNLTRPSFGSRVEPCDRNNDEVSVRVRDQGGKRRKGETERERERE